MLLSSQIHHFCSALPQTLPLSFAPVHNSTSVSGQTLGHQQHGVLEANRLTRVLLENVAREMQCVWPECTFRAASWALLNKHVVQTHCVTPAAVLRNTSRRGLANRLFVCRFPKCTHHAYLEADYLADHVAKAHLNHLKLTCPAPHCTSRAPFETVQLLISHLARSHGQTLDSLPKSGLQPLSPAPSLPPLPDAIPSWQALLQVQVAGSPRFSTSPEYISRHPVPIPDPFFGEHLPHWLDSDVSFSAQGDLQEETTEMHAELRRVPKGRELDGNIPRVAAYKHGSIRESTALSHSKKRFRPSSVGIFALVDETGYDPTKRLAVKWRILDPSCDSAWSDDDGDDDNDDDVPRAANRRKL